VNPQATNPAHPMIAPRWLVLGAAGFVGRTVLATLQAQGRRVGGVTRPSMDALAGESLRNLLRTWRPDIVLNATGHARSASGPDLSDFYVRSTTLLLQAVRAEAPACRVILLGSAAEYGNAVAPTGSVETDALQPLSDYGRAKVAQSRVASGAAGQGLAVITARLFNPCGPGQGTHQFVGALLERLRAGEHPLRVYPGNQLRDWGDIRDMADALMLLGETAHPPAVVNVCTGTAHSTELVASLLGRLAGVPVEATPGPVGPDTLWHSVGHPGRLTRLGWRPKFTLAETLADQYRSRL